MRFCDALPCTILPNTALPATVEQLHQLLVLTRFGPIRPVSNITQLTTLRATIAPLLTDARWTVKDFSESDDGSHIAQAIIDGTCIPVSDGSYKDNRGTAFWIMEGSDSEFRLQSPLNIPGHHSDQTAYRSELGGLCAIVTMVSVLCQHYSITKGSVEIACNSLSTLNRITEDHHVIRPNTPQFDLLEATRAVMTECSIDWKHRHVKGHQDNLYGPLERWATLNVLCDLGAKERWAQIADAPPVQWRIHKEEPWPLWIGDQKSAYNCERKWIQGHIPSDSVSHVDWQGVQKAKKAASRTRQHWVAKHTTGFCATGEIMLRRKKWETAASPRCKAPVEDSEHIIRYTQANANIVWTKALKNFEQWLVQQKTAQQIIEAMLKGLQACRSGNIANHRRYSTLPGLQETVERQNLIGWRGLFDSFPALGWA